MNEDTACKIISILFTSAGVICAIGLVLVLIYSIMFYLLSSLILVLILLVICYIIGKASFPEWNKLEVK